MRMRRGLSPAPGQPSPAVRHPRQLGDPAVRTIHTCRSGSPSHQRPAVAPVRRSRRHPFGRARRVARLTLPLGPQARGKTAVEVLVRWAEQEACCRDLRDDACVRYRKAAQEVGDSMRRIDRKVAEMGRRREPQLEYPLPALPLQGREPKEWPETKRNSGRTCTSVLRRTRTASWYEPCSTT